MSKKQAVILWSFQIVLYIANIILTIIKGGTLITCILGWLIASMLAGLIIYLCFRLSDKNKTIEAEEKAYRRRTER